MIRINMFQGRLLCVSVWCEWSLVALYTDQDSKLLDSIVCFAEVVLTNFWSVYAEQDASYTRNPTIFKKIRLVAGLIISSIDQASDGPSIILKDWKKNPVGCWLGLLQRMLQEIMKKNLGWSDTWSMRQSYIPRTLPASVLYWLSDLCFLIQRLDKKYQKEQS